MGRRIITASVVLALVACTYSNHPPSDLAPAHPHNASHRKRPTGGFYACIKHHSERYCHDTDNDDLYEPTQPDPADERRAIRRVAYEMATVDQGGYVERDDPSVAAIAAAVNVLVRKCPDSPTHVGDMAVATQQEMAKRLVNESLESIVTHVGRVALSRDGTFQSSCADIFAAYAELRA